jgi:hypothetical protein
MRRLPLLLAACTLAAPAAFAVDRQFSDIVRAISDEFHTRPMHIPLFGLVNAVTFVARPAGTSHIDLAVFEHIDTGDRTGRDLQQIVQRAVGRGWQPFVQVHSRHHGGEELVMVYMRPEGRECRLLVTSIERSEATVVQLKLNPDGLQRWISDPEGSARSTHGDDSDR